MSPAHNKISSLLHQQKPSSINPFLNIVCIFAVESKTRHCILEHEEDIIPTRILRHGQLSDGESLERGV
jgi:hypothetical protein